MDFTIKPLLPGMDFAGEVIGIDVASPINSSVYDQLRTALESTLCLYSETRT